MKTPAGSWTERAKQPADDDEEECEEVEPGKDTTLGTLEQAWVFPNAVNKPTGVNGGLPDEVHDLWGKLKGPGTIPERHALRNTAAPRDAGYEHIVYCEEGALMQQMKQAFSHQAKKVPAHWPFLL